MESITITDPNIIHFFQTNEFIDPKKFIEKHILAIIGKKEEIKENETDIDYQQLQMEYSLFMSHQKNIINFMKENTKLVDKLQLCYLENLLSNKLNITKEVHTCELCSRGFRNLKALTTHHRSCFQKQVDIGSGEA
jgi:hypothetical protein